MSSTRIEFDTTQADALLREVAANLSDMTPVMDQIGEVLINSTRARFDQGIAPDGTAWAPNTPATIARKGSAKPLIGQTRILSRTIFHAPRADGVSWGSSLIYSAVQQMGAGKGVFGQTSSGQSIPFGTIPARPFIGISDDDSTAIITALEAFLDPD